MSDASDRPRERPGGRALAICLATLIALAAAGAGYEQVFSTNADYDDEGYVMLSLVSSMHGKPLYDETYTQYGPAFFALERAFFRASGLPVSHDVTRSKTLALWLAAAFLAAAVVRRLGGSHAAALAAFLVTFFHLERLCLEPGHPQEVCVLALLAVPLVIGPGTRDRSVAWRSVAVGLIAGIVLMTKTNVGILLLAASALALLLAGPASGWTTRVGAVAVPATLVLPFVVAHRHLLAPGGFVLPAIVASATLGVVTVARRRPHRPLASRDLVLFAVGVAATVAASAIGALAGGTTPGGLAYGLVGQHLAFVSAFASPAPVPAACVLWAVISVVLAMRSAHDRRGVATAAAVAALALAWTSSRYLVETFVPLTHGLVDRGGSGLLVGLAAPALWVLFAPDGLDDARFAPRLALCLVAALQPLGAYPSPGTQMAIGSVAVAVAAIVALDDAARALPRARVAMPALAASLVVILGVRDVALHARRAGMASLDLPGAARVRMPARDAARYRWLAATLRANADTFVFGEHARDSFYFWTGLEPPTGLNPTFWPHLLRHDEQRRIIAALDATPRVAVVHERYDGRLPADSPLLAYLATRFRPAFAEDDFEVWLPK